MNPTFADWSIDDRSDANYFLPYGESRLSHFPITMSFVQVSPYSEVRSNDSEGRKKTLRVSR
jgi:hypothetical protein